MMPLGILQLSQNPKIGNCREKPNIWVVERPDHHCGDDLVFLSTVPDDLYPFGPMYGDQELYFADRDEDYIQLPITGTFLFGAVEYDSIFVSQQKKQERPPIGGGGVRNVTPRDDASPIWTQFNVENVEIKVQKCLIPCQRENGEALQLFAICVRIDRQFCAHLILLGYNLKRGLYDLPV